jgi:hypothetical protein
VKPGRPITPLTSPLPEPPPKRQVNDLKDYQVATGARFSRWNMAPGSIGYEADQAACGSGAGSAKLAAAAPTAGTTIDKAKALDLNGLYRCAGRARCLGGTAGGAREWPRSRPRPCAAPHACWLPAPPRPPTLRPYPYPHPRCPGNQNKPLKSCNIFAADFAADGIIQACDSTIILQLDGTGPGVVGAQIK